MNVMHRMSNFFITAVTITYCFIDIIITCSEENKWIVSKWANTSYNVLGV